MKNWCGAPLLVLVLGTLAYGQELTKDDFVTLKKKGVDDELLTRIAQSLKSPISLSADDIIELRQAGMGEDAVQALLQAKKTKTSEKTDKQSVSSPETASVRVQNKSGSSLSVSVDVSAREFVVALGRSPDMTAVEPGSGIEIQVPLGEYRVRWKGRGAALTLSIGERAGDDLHIIEQQDDDCCGGGVALTLTTVRRDRELHPATKGEDHRGHEHGKHRE